MQREKSEVSLEHLLVHPPYKASPRYLYFFQPFSQYKRRHSQSRTTGNIASGDRDLEELQPRISHDSRLSFRCILIGHSRHFDNKQEEGLYTEYFEEFDVEYLTESRLAVDPEYLEIVRDG